MREDGKLDYLELPGGDLPTVKTFYGAAFGWTFVDYGPSYAAFNEGLDGGFDGDAAEATKTPLPVLYAHDLDAMLAKVQAAGGVVEADLRLPGRTAVPLPRSGRKRAGGLVRDLTAWTSPAEIAACAAS